MKSTIFRGLVTKNKGNGTKFGYPTANIFVHDKKLDGLFLGYTSIISNDGEKLKTSRARLPSLIFVGAAHTVGEVEHRLESHILDFPKEDLYGKEIEVEIIKKLRSNEKFAGEAELVRQMKIDEQQARKWFKL